MPGSATTSPPGERGPAAPPGHGSPLLVDETRQEASVRGQRLDLSPTEFALLACLVRHGGQTVAYDAFLREVWGISLHEGGSLPQVRSSVTRLRQKLAAAAGHSCQIVIAFIGLAMVGTFRLAAQGPAPLPPIDAPGRVGIRYGQIPDNWGFKPGISAQRAIEAAREVEGASLLDPNAQIAVKLVLFSDEGAYKENDQGESVFVFRDIPAWIVTFSNIKYPLPGSGSRRHAGPIDYLTQIHVAVDATSGKAIETYGWD